MTRRISSWIFSPCEAGIAILTPQPISILHDVELIHLNAPDKQTAKPSAILEVLSLTDDQCVSWAAPGCSLFLITMKVISLYLLLFTNCFCIFALSLFFFTQLSAYTKPFLFFSQIYMQFDIAADVGFLMRTCEREWTCPSPALLDSLI